MTDLRFADDISVKDIERYLREKKLGFKIHKGKTKYTTNFETSETQEIEN